MKVLWILFYISLSWAQAERKLDRLDPHGDKSLNLKQITSLKGHSECTVCHEDSKGKITTKTVNTDTCTSCHNKVPHSGVADHLGRSYKGQPISCLSCHAAHRSEGKDWERPSDFFKSKKELSLPVDLKIKSNAASMIRQSCSECHKW